MALNYEAKALAGANQFVSRKKYGVTNLSESPDSLGLLLGTSDYNTARTISNGILDFTNGFLIPAVSDIILGTKYKSIESGGLGVDLELGLDLKWLSKYGIGVEGMAASQTTYFFTGADKGDIQEIIYASAGAAGLFGLYLPILSYTYKHQKNVGGSTDSSDSTNLQSQASANPLASVSLDAQPQNTTALNTDTSASEPSTSSSGTYSQAATGAITPVIYNPNFASTSSAAPTATLLGANTETLYVFEIFSGSSVTSSTAGSSEAITIHFAGSGLTPTSDPITVDILGTFIDPQDSNNRAQAAVTINADGTLASVEIKESGQYSYLLETANKSGEFVLALDLIGAGLVADPSSAKLPLVSIPVSYSSVQSGLVATPVLRIPSAQIATTAANTSSTSSETNFPVYNSQTNTTTAPNSGNLATYSYSGVPLTVAASGGDPLKLLNQNLTARTIFSNGQLIAVEPEQTIYFNAAQRSADGYQLTVDFQAFGTQQDNPELAALGSATVSIPEAQEQAYNNVVSESGFSAQVGSTNAGVYLSDGHTDTTPLLPEQGVQPVFNRVVYNNNDFVWYLNATDGGVVQPEYLSEAISAGEAPATFSAAISPVAVTIASPASSSSATNSFGGDTLVAWVEATDPVIPLTSDNGEQNFQAFMDALYGNQRINYRIQQSSATDSSGWSPMDEQKISSLYQADNAVITQLKAFNTHNPNSNNPVDQITLLAWVETPLPGVSDQTARLKVATINPTAPTYSWDSLTSDAEGNSTIQTIPWDGTSAAALTIDDLSIASLPLKTHQASLAVEEGAGEVKTLPDVHRAAALSQTLTHLLGDRHEATTGVVNTPVLSFSRDVRTPYQQSVLEDEPTLYLSLNALQSGTNSINLGTSGDTASQTFASDTGLDFSIDSALPLSQGTAVQNSNGTGVLISGLGTFNRALTNQFNQIAPDPQAETPATTLITSFTGSITGTTLTAPAQVAPSLEIGDVLTGEGLRPGTTIIASVDAEVGTFALNQDVASPITDGNFKAYPDPDGLPYTTLEASIAGTTLTVSNLNGSLSVGDRIGGAGIEPGTTITEVISPYANGSGTYTVNLEQTAGSATDSIAAISSPGAGSNPYTIEFWAQLQPGTNPDGAGLVALGQPSEDAVGPVELPDGWLMTSSFVVDRISYHQAAARGMIDSIPSSVSNANDLYAWGWAVIADGANTTAMDGSGGSNLYSNALAINNLQAGRSNPGVAAFLEANGLETSDLIGRGGYEADVMVAVPTTQLDFAHFIDPSTNAPQSNLNAVALDTRSTALNEGVVSMADASSSDATTTAINSLFEQLWAFQQKTGEAKVNFSLAPVAYRLSQQITSTYSVTAEQVRPLLSDPSQLVDLIAANSDLTSSEAQTWLDTQIETLQQDDASADNPYSIDQFSGYQLGFSLSSGPAVSVNSAGQLVFDVGGDQQVLSTNGVDLRDGNWHYIAASFLPNTSDYITNSDSLVELYSNVGVASLYVDNELVGQNSSVVDAYQPENANDELVMLTNNVGGAIDQLALYNTALSSLTPPAASSDWPMPNSEFALSLLREAGVQIDGKTPDPGAIPGAVTAHWDARDVNPNDAVLNTFYSIYDTTSSAWSTPTTLNPQLAPTPTQPSAAAASSIQDLWSFDLNATGWSQKDWTVTTSSSGSTPSTTFNPSGLTLEAVSVSLSGSSVPEQTLTADQVLIGDATLAALQPFATDQNLNYTFLSNSPALTLLLDPTTDRLSAAEADATVTLSFSNGTKVSNTNPVAVNRVAAAAPSQPLTATTAAAALPDIQSRNQALATAAVIEQAPLQLKYIDSGEVIKRQSNDQGFGTSQVAGAFKTATDNTYSGWLAIAQPFTRAAVSNPAGRIWVQYTGDFTTTTGSASGTRTAVADPATAPITWLNALAEADFSTDHPTLPLLDSALYPSSSGGLLIEADPTVGWGDAFGQTMLSADVNGDGIDELIIAAPQANGGGRVYIIDGKWIQNNLTTDNGATTLSLANPDDLGDYVVVLTPTVASDSSGEPNSNDRASVAGFGSSLAFDTATSTLWIGAPNYLRQLNTAEPSIASEQSIGALYSYSASSDSTGWSSAEPKALTPVQVGQGGTTTSLGPDGSPLTTYWGSQFGSAVAVDSTSSQLAVSAPGLQAGLLYSGSEAAREKYLKGKRNPSDADGDGGLIAVQLPDPISNNGQDYTLSRIDVSKGTNSAFTAIGSDNDKLSSVDTTYMQSLKALQTDNIAGATVYNNQAVQAEAVGAVYLYDAQSNALTTPQHTYYGPNPWNVLGPVGFGSSLAFIDLDNSNSKQLAVGADATAGPGAVYLLNPNASSNALTAADLGNNQQLAHLAASSTLFGAEAQDQFGNGVVNLGDVNQDGYEDLLIQAMNAGSGAGNGYVVFGSDQFNNDSSNPAIGTVAAGSIGLFQRADGTSFTSAILQEFGYGGGFTGSGSYGVGDLNADGINDIQLGSGQNNNAYLTWGHPYLEAVDTLDLDKLASNTGYMLDGLATTTPGSLRSIGDFNGDGYDDFISIQPGEFVNNVRIELGANTQEILADYLYNHYNFTVSPDTQVLPAGDINGDGLADLALFLNDNFSSAAEGNQGAGSTTGILYGRSSDQLPIGSGFGFLSPVDPDSNAPLTSLPGQQISGGLSNASPAVIAVGNTLYAAVKGTGDGDTSIWFAQSTDGGSSWSDWNDLSSQEPGFATNTAPALGFFEQTLYLGFTDPSGALQFSSFDPASTTLTNWSTPAAIASTQPGALGFRSSVTPAFLDQGDALALLWLDSSDTASPNTLYSAVSTTPDSAKTVVSAPSLWSGVDGGSSPATPALAQLGDTLYMAVQGNGDNSIYWSSSSDGGTSWADWQALPSGMTSAKAPSLAAFDGTLYLSYLGDGNNEINITSLSDAATNTWASQYVIEWSGGQPSAEQASLVTETINGSEQLSVYYIAINNTSDLLRTASSNPASSSSWSDQISVDYNNGAAIQTASGPLAVTSKNGQTVIAYQGGTADSQSNEIYLATSSSPASSSSWSLQAYTDPGQRTGLGLTNVGDELLLSYSTNASADALQLQTLSLDGDNWEATNTDTTALISSGSNLVSILQADTNSSSGLVLAGINSSSNDIEVSLAETSTAHDSWTAPKQMLERSVAGDGSVNFTPITATAAPVATMLGADPVVALNNNGAINVYSPSASGSSLNLASSFAATGSEPAISTDQAPGLTTTDTGLALTYTNTDQSVALQRLDFFSLAGDLADGVSLSADGLISSEPDLLWQPSSLNASNGGISTSLATAPVVVDGNLLLTSVDPNLEQVRINAVPALSDPDSSGWINSTIQLPDGNGGWMISQTDASAPSTLIAIGDLDGDGNDDLVITNPDLAVAAVSIPDVWAGVDGGSSPATPALAQLGDTLYMAVQGNGDNSIYWSSSSDGGTSWADWQALPSGMTSAKAPSLAAFDGTLYLSYLDVGKNEINITSLTDAATNTWADQYEIPWSGGSQSALQASLVNETVDGSDQLAVYYTATNGTSALLRTGSSDPTSSSSWSDQISVDYNNGSAIQTASGPLAVTSKNGQTVIAYQGGTADSQSNEIYLATSSSPASSSSWSLQAYTDPGQRTGLGLTNVGDQLLLSYSTNASADALQLQTLSLNGSNWEASKTDTTALMASGSNDVSILISTATETETIVLAGINSSNGNAVEVQTASTTTSMPGARLISGAASAGEFFALNDATNSEQAVQLAPALTGTTAVNTISAALTGSGSLSLNALSGDDAYNVSGSFTDPDPWLASANAADPIASAQQLFSNAFAEADGWTSTPAGPLLGDPALNTTTSFGDLNGDGYEDYLAEMPTRLSGTDQQAWDVWSIRAAGDVNGNGVDDVLLTLAPITPTTLTTEPNYLQTVLLDGYLFNVNKNNGYGNFSITYNGLKKPLKPFILAEEYDNNSTESSEYLPLLQNWLEPLQAYVPPQMTSASLTNTAKPASAEVYEIPASVASESMIYTAFKGESGKTLWVASQAIADASSATQTEIPNGFVPGRTDAAVAATLFKNSLYVVTTDNDGNLYITGGDPDNVADWTLNEQIRTSNGTNDESTQIGSQIALLQEGDRLALYFTSNDNSSAPRYLYSTDPSMPGTWGSTYNPSSNTYTGSSQTINSDKANDISATLFQNKTVLAYNNNGTTTLVTSKSFQPKTSSDWFKSTTTEYSADPNSLTTDQNQLYMTSVQGYLNIFRPNSEVPGQWLSNGPNSNETRVLTANAYAFMVNGQLKVSEPPPFGSGDLLISDVVLTTDSKTQKPSLAGYSIDSNLDVNGDGFADMLVSDPSDPTEGIDNQYVLFGGDYLDIANQVGTNGNDTLIGTPLADVIYTIAGDDTVISNGGADVIYTGAGADTISITGNSFFRVDAGSGIDTLLLEGDANQNYDFRLDVGSPKYFAGTKLRNIELISSIDYGSNILSLDPKAVSAFNDQRMLFLTPDNTDFIIFSSDSDYGFVRNTSYDTNLGGAVWNAYAASASGSFDTADNPTLAYVLNPEPGDDDWLRDHVITTPANTSPSLMALPAMTSAAMLEAPQALSNPSLTTQAALPISSPVTQAVGFGNGLTFKAFKSLSTDSSVRFEISRANPSVRQVVAYASSTANSTAETGSDYHPVAGYSVLEAGDTSKLITVPINQQRLEQLRSAGVSLEVEEVADVGQQELHLVVSSQSSDETYGDLISGFALESLEGTQSALLSFRTDTGSTSEPTSAALQSYTGESPTASELTIYSRASADADISSSTTKSQTINISDFKADADPLSFDHDATANAQVSAKLLLTTQPGSSLVSLLNNQGQLQSLPALGSTPLPPVPQPEPTPQPEPLSISASTSQDTKTLAATVVSTENVVTDSARSELSDQQVDLSSQAIDFEVETGDESPTVTANIPLTALLGDLTLTTGDGKRDPSIAPIYYAINAQGALLPLSYDPLVNAAARFYDIDADGITDFLSLKLIDGDMGDKDGRKNGVINHPSAMGTVALDPVITALENGFLQVADAANAAPAAIALQASLTSRADTVTEIGYVILNEGEEASTVSDLTAFQERANTLFSTLENNDVTLTEAMVFNSQFLLRNGQSIRFFAVTDGTLADLASLEDSRFSFLDGSVDATTGAASFSSASGIGFDLALLNSDQNLSALIAQEQHVAPLLDFTAFTNNETITGTIVQAREADYDAVTGFYRVLDTSGSVRAADGSLLTPGDAGYAAAALLEANRISAFDNLSIADGETSSTEFSLQEASTIAPFAQVNGNTFFAFADANTDGLSHFRTLGSNLFGLEDQLGGGDLDYDDHIVGFSIGGLTPANPVA